MNEMEGEPQGLPPREVIEYFEIPLRRPWLTVVPFVLCSLIAAAGYMLAPKRYASQTLILVETERVPEMLTKAVIERSGERMKVLKQQLLSRTRIERIVRELEPYPELAGKRSTSQIIDIARNAIDIKTKGDDAFFITFQHTSPYLAMAVTNRLASLFIEEAGQLREQQLSTATRFIENQLEEARQQLEAKEKEVRALKEKFAGSLPEEMGTNLSTLQRLGLEKDSLLGNLVKAEDRAMTLERDLNQELQRAAAAPGLSRGAGPSLAEEQLFKTREQLMDLRSRYTEEHPEVKRMAARVARLEEQLARAPGQPATPDAPAAVLNPAVTSLRDQLVIARTDVARLRKAQVDLEARVLELEQRVARTPSVETQLTSLNRDYRKLTTAYEVLLQKKLDSAMAENLERQWKSQRYVILDPAYLPDTPSSPRPFKYAAVGIGVGLLLGLGLAVGAELLDHSVKNARELEAVLPHPLLVTVPYLRWRRRRRRQVPDGAVSET